LLKVFYYCLYTKTTSFIKNLIGLLAGTDPEAVELSTGPPKQHGKVDIGLEVGPRRP